MLEEAAGLLGTDRSRAAAIASTEASFVLAAALPMRLQATGLGSLIGAGATKKAPLWSL